jgi:hypothetical protein
MHAYSVNDSLIAQYVQTDLVYLVLEAQLISLSPHDLIHLNTLPLFQPKTLVGFTGIKYQMKFKFPRSGV